MKTEKQFAFPFSVLCITDVERAQCIAILNELGYESVGNINNESEIFTNIDGISREYFTCFPDNMFRHAKGRYHIPHFDAALVRDIAAACTNDIWFEDEPAISKMRTYGHVTSINVGSSLSVTMSRRPTIAEICAHHGYEIVGKDIVKQQKQSTMKEKKYRPYKEIPIEILGKGVMCKATPPTAAIMTYNAVGIITVISSHRHLAYILGANFDTKQLCDDFVFVDTGLPVGEEYEEECKPFPFVHDTAYCVRENNRCEWRVRYFKEYTNGVPMFYNDGLTSISSSQNLSTKWSHVAPYDKCLKNKCQEPDVYLYKKD